MDDPFLFWTFDTAILNPPNPTDTQPEIKPERSLAGDDCHRNIYHVPPKRADQVRKRILPHYAADVHLCINGAGEPFTEQRVIELQELRESMLLGE